LFQIFAVRVPAASEAREDTRAGIAEPLADDSRPAIDENESVHGMTSF